VVTSPTADAARASRIPTYSKACQASDWPTHKKNCKNLQNAHLEKVLARVADIVQQAYYDFRRNTWDFDVVKVEEHSDALVIYEEDLHEKKEYFIKFPSHLLKDERNAKSVLCTYTCNEPFAWMHKLLYLLLQGTIM
jgi:hypothetical protein